eukprot:8303438-Pyramimonas_sp.AAC.1
MGLELWEGNKFADQYAKLGARLQQHPDWHRAACIQRFKLVADVLEFAAYVGDCLLYTSDAADDTPC